MERAGAALTRLPGRRPSRGRILRWVAAAVGVAIGGWLAIAWASWPDVAALSRTNPSSTAFIERARSDGAEVRWTWVPDSRISVHLKRAVVAAEDMEFFSHDGFSTTEIRAALRDAVREGKKLRGASTITQQLAKNLWLSPSRSPLRKVRELLLTRELERRLSKRRILEIYLNVVELGPGIYGVEAAARHYFGIPAAAVSERQAAELAASLPRPAAWHPGADSDSYRRYVADIRRRMDKADFLRNLVEPSTTKPPGNPREEGASPEG